MKKIRLFSFIGIIFVLLFSCGGPPADMPETNIIEIISKNINILREIKNNPEKSLKYFKDITNNFNALIAFYKDSSITVLSEETTPNNDDFIYTLNNNEFLVRRGLYITSQDKDVLYSFDKNIWYSNKSDANKEIEGIRNDYYISSKVEGNNIFIKYKMSLAVGRKPIIIKLDKPREIVTLKKDMIFANKDESKITVNLKEKILYIPENTLLKGSVNVTGNLVESQYKKGLIYIKALQNIYIYIKGMSFSVSFDKRNWNPNILSFDINPDIEVYAKEDNEVFFNVTATAIYDKDKVSMSLVKLFLKRM